MAGFIVMPLIGIMGLVALITLSSISSLLPTLVFSAAFSVFPPVGLGILLATGIFAACAYLFVNHKKQVNNGYKLDFAKPEILADSRSSTHELVTTRIANEPSPPGKERTPTHTSQTSEIEKSKMPRVQFNLNGLGRKRINEEELTSINSSSYSP